MNPAIEDYLTNADRFDVVVGAGTDWTAPSPCEEWTAAGVLDHVVETQRSFLAERGAEIGERPAGTPTEVWAAHVAAVAAATTDDDFVSSEYDGYFGRTTLADTLANFYGFDMIVHRWDLGRSLGQDVTWDEAEMQLLEQAMAGFGDALYSPGVCGPAVDVPTDASRQDRILGRLGRQPTS